MVKTNMAQYELEDYKLKVYLEKERPQKTWIDVVRKDMINYIVMENITFSKFEWKHRTKKVNRERKLF